MRDESIECPCYHICAALGIETRPWCRYRKSDLPPPGMRRFNPKEEWCPPGVQASVLLLARLLSEGRSRPQEAREVLRQVRVWAESLRAGERAYDPLGRKPAGG